MRLTERQKTVIREAGLRHFGVAPWLFGSRLDDEKRGGDIDLFIPGDWSAEESVRRRIAFCAEVRRRLGDQKIDVLVESRHPSPAQEAAKAQGRPV
jgi:predicted nucleotidyltransferase